MEYADTSFLLSYYIPDANHAAARKHVQGWKKPPGLPLTSFGAYEFNNSMRRLLHKNVLRLTDLAGVARAMRADVAAGILVDAPLEAWRWLDEANQVSRQVTPRTGTRALDVMHIAQARIRGAKVFLSFDQNQRLAARATGLTVAP